MENMFYDKCFIEAQTTGHSHYGADADVRLQRPLFSALLSPNDPVFLLIVSAVTQRPHIFWWNVGSSIALTQRPPIRHIIFAIFDDFLQIPAFKTLTERSKVTFSPNAP